MNSLRNLPISRRLWLILVLSLLMLALLGGLMLQQINSGLHAGKAQKTQHVVETSVGILKHFHALETAGTLSREQAQKQAMTLVGSLRYNQTDYFWINDLTPTMIMHPANPKLDGQNLSGFKDLDGKALFNEFVRVAKSQGAGFVDYRWPKPGSDEPIAKIS